MKSVLLPSNWISRKIFRWLIVDLSPDRRQTTIMRAVTELIVISPQSSEQLSEAPDKLLVSYTRRRILSSSGDVKEEVVRV